MNAARPRKVGPIVFSLCCAVAMGAAATILSEKSSPPTEVTYWCIGDCEADEDSGWFNPHYSHTIIDVQRAILDRWQIGNHTYATRDIMGRRI